MKKPLTAAIAMSFAALPVLSGAAMAETKNVAKQDKSYKIQLLKSEKNVFALEKAGNAKVKPRFIYNGPRDAFFINGIN